MFLGSSCCNIAENSTFARPLDFACRLNPSFHAFAEACATETLGAYSRGAFTDRSSLLNKTDGAFFGGPQVVLFQVPGDNFIKHLSFSLLTMPRIFESFYVLLIAFYVNAHIISHG